MHESEIDIMGINGGDLCFAVFGLDSPLGLFPGGLDGCRNPLLEMADPRTAPDLHPFAKKKSEYTL